MIRDIIENMVIIITAWLSVELIMVFPTYIIMSLIKYNNEVIKESICLSSIISIIIIIIVLIHGLYFSDDTVHNIQPLHREASDSSS